VRTSGEPDGNGFALVPGFLRGPLDICETALVP